MTAVPPPQVPMQAYWYYKTAQLSPFEGGPLNLLFFYSTTRQEATLTGPRHEACCSAFRICLVHGSASATATARVLLSTLNTVPERHGAVPRAAKLLIPAGTVCSSTRAELVAMRGALEEVPQLGDDLDETPLILAPTRRQRSLLSRAAAGHRRQR